MSWFPTNLIVPMILLVIGLVLLFIYFLNLARLRASEAWPSVQGVVTEAWIRENESTDEDGSTSRSYYPEIRYQYQVMGETYSGEKISFGPSSGGGRSRAAKTLNKYPVNSPVMVYYDPQNPENAVLERRVSKLLLVYGIIFLAAAIFVYIRWG